MSHNISSSDIHIVPVDGCEKKNLKSVTIEKEDGLTKMSWVTEINVTELERRSKNEPKIFVAKSFLLLGKFYSPYILFVFFSRLKTGHFRYYASVAICPFIEQLLEDQNNQEQSSTKKGSKHKPLCGIWISANQAENIPFDIRLLEQDEIWLPITHYSYQLEPHQTYEFSFQLWFKLIDQSAPLAEKNALKQFSTLFIDQTLCDIKFCFENGQSVGGHKSFLAARSKVFAAMFQHEMQETKTGKVVITDIQPDIFRDLLFFIYSGQLETSLTEEKAKMLFVAADKYDIEDLKTICLSFLLAYMHIHNATHFLVWVLECIANVVVSDCQMAPLYGTWTCPKVSIGDN